MNDNTIQKFNLGLVGVFFDMTGLQCQPITLVAVCFYVPYIEQVARESIRVFSLSWSRPIIGGSRYRSRAAPAFPIQGLNQTKSASINSIPVAARYLFHLRHLCVGGTKHHVISLLCCMWASNFLYQLYNQGCTYIEGIWWPDGQ